MNFKRYIKDLIRPLYQRILSAYILPKENLYIKKQTNNLSHRISQLKSKDVVSVVFLPYQSSNWKYDNLYRRMLDDKRFEPHIILCPQTNKGHEVMMKNLNSMKAFFSKLQYDFINPYDEINNSWIDIRALFNPDIIFYTEPYKGIVHQDYEYSNFSDKLICYSSYSLILTNHKWLYDLEFHNIAWCIFVSDNIIKDYAKKMMRNKGINVYATGYLGGERFLDAVNRKKDVKNESFVTAKSLKKIIWAPHHSIKGGLGYSTFLAYHSFWQTLAKKYENKIFIYFKPHPILYNELLEIWGLERTESYYDYWKKLPNAEYVEGDYLDCFMDSDALIHDCYAFTYEYLYFNKPVAFLCKKGKKLSLNELGQEAFDTHYHLYCEQEIIDFIEDIIFKDKDIMKETRDSFYNEHIKIEGKMPSEKAFDFIINHLPK